MGYFADGNGEVFLKDGKNIKELLVNYFSVCSKY